MEDKVEYLVYAHYFEDSETPFYIGCSKKICRALDYRERNGIWSALTRDKLFTVAILIAGVSKNEALEIEKDLIIHYGIMNDGGVLCNMAYGISGVFTEGYGKLNVGDKMESKFSDRVSALKSVKNWAAKCYPDKDFIAEKILNKVYITRIN